MSQPFAFVALPDTQVYARDHAEVFAAQGRFVVENAERLGIAAVIHEGDVVFDNDEAQWTVARRALAPVVGHADLIFALGNHDYGDGGSCNSRETLLHEHFPYDELAGQPSFGGSFEPHRADNVWHRFESPYGPWLVVGLEFAPRDEVVAWARAVLHDHHDATAVLATHAYLYHDDTRYDRTRDDQRWAPHKYGVAKRAPINTGEDLFRKLIEPSPNVRIVLCGHVIDPGLARRTDRRPDGTLCHQLLCNFQTDRRGGNGFLRILQLSADGARMHVRTYSPFVDKWRRDPANELVLEL